MKVIDVALAPDLQAHGSVFGQPYVRASPQVEPILRRSAVPPVKAVASGDKRLDPPSVFLSEIVGVVGRIE